MIMRSTVKEKEPGGINPATKRHLGSQIKTLQDAPRDADKLERLLQVKRRQKEKSAIPPNTVMSPHLFKRVAVPDICVD
jgi:hypothetical protein